jgi:uncharacterized membrane protein
MPANGRVTSLDALRGTVMIIMALDHVRDFFHSGAMVQSPTNMATTTPALFLTRWITHFCAPVFLFAAGTSACLWLAGGRRTKDELSRFLLTRGLWLIALEVFVIRFALYFSWSLKYPVLLITLWALGASMIALAALIHLPVRLLAALSVAVILLHNFTDRVQASSFGSFGWIWNVLHQPGAISVAGVVVVVGYPLLPLAATMAAGYCAGHLFQGTPNRIQRDAPSRQRTLFWLGGAMTVAFILMRAINVYGDPVRWMVQKSTLMTVLSYLNCTKQPASADFLLMTLGPALILLAIFDRAEISESNPLLTYGRVPLFYFVVHFVLIHLIQVAATWLRYGFVPFLFVPPPSVEGPRELFPPGFGYDLWVVYVIWVLVVLTMYPACRWFSKIKARRRDWWLSYL